MNSKKLNLMETCSQISSKQTFKKLSIVLNLQTFLQDGCPVQNNKKQDMP